MTIVIGPTGQKPYPWTTDRKVDLGKGQVTHSFLVIPECPVPLLARDLLAKLKTQISFSSEGANVYDTGHKIRRI